MKKIISKILLLSLVLSLFSPLTVNAEQMTFGQILDDLTKAENDYNKNKESISNQQYQISSDNKTINNLKDEIESIRIETENLTDEIEQSEKDIAKKSEQTKNIISYLQMSQGENIYLEYAFGTETVTDLVYRLAVVEQISEYNNQVITELQELIEKNENKKVELADTEKKHEQKIESLNKEIQRLTNNIASLGSLSPSLEQEVKSKQERVNYYKEQGCKNRSDVIGIDCAVTTSNAYFSRPIKNGYITSFVGYRWGSLHRGLDMGSSYGRNTALYSIGNGVITSIWQDGAGAKCVNVEYKTTNGQYYTAIYAHMSRYGNIYEGMKVNPDTILGYMGDTGLAYGVHLHLELWPCRLYVDNKCSTWNKYTSFVESQFKSGFKGAESAISFPNRTYQTWTTK